MLDSSASRWTSVYAPLRPLWSERWFRCLLCRDSRNNRDVTIKALRPSVLLVASERRRALRALRREAEILEMLGREPGRPVFPRLVEASLDEAQPWIALERLAGPTLEELWIQDDGEQPGRSRWTLPELLEAILSLRSGLVSLVQQGHVHGFLRPGVLSLDEESGKDSGARRAFQLRVRDLGCATLDTDEAPIPPSYALPYVSPLVLERRTAPSWEADAWSLAAIVLEQVTGEVAFRAKSSGLTHQNWFLARRLAAEEPKPERLDPLPAGLRRWLATAMDRRIRPEKAEAFFDGIGPCIEEGRGHSLWSKAALPVDLVSESALAEAERFARDLGLREGFDEREDVAATESTFSTHHGNLERLVQTGGSRRADSVRERAALLRNELLALHPRLKLNPPSVSEVKRHETAYRSLRSLALAVQPISEKLDPERSTAEPWKAWLDELRPILTDPMDPDPSGDPALASGKALAARIGVLQGQTEHVRRVVDQATKLMQGVVSGLGQRLADIVTSRSRNLTALDSRTSEVLRKFPSRVAAVAARSATVELLFEVLAIEADGLKLVDLIDKLPLAEPEPPPVVAPPVVHDPEPTTVEEEPDAPWLEPLVRKAAASLQTILQRILAARRTELVVLLSVAALGVAALGVARWLRYRTGPSPPPPVEVVVVPDLPEVVRALEIDDGTGFKQVQSGEALSLRPNQVVSVVVTCSGGSRAQWEIPGAEIAGIDRRCSERCAVPPTETATVWIYGRPGQRLVIRQGDQRTELSQPGWLTFKKGAPIRVEDSSGRRGEVPNPTKDDLLSTIKGLAAKRSDAPLIRSVTKRRVEGVLAAAGEGP